MDAAKKDKVDGGARFDMADDMVNKVMNVISLQSLIYLLRNPKAKMQGTQERDWLLEVVQQYAAADCKMLVVIL